MLMIFLLNNISLVMCGNFMGCVTWGFYPVVLEVEHIRSEKRKLDKPSKSADCSFTLTMVFWNFLEPILEVELPQQRRRMNRPKVSASARRRH